MLVVRSLFKGMPISFTVSLFAIEPRAIVTVGYYRGYGAVAVNLVNITGAAGEWFSEYGDVIEPSLIALLSYTSGNYSRTVIVTIPYDSTWIIKHKPITIVALINFTGVKPIPIIKTNTNASLGNTPTWVLNQYNVSEEPVPLIFIAWGSKAVKTNIGGITSISITPSSSGTNTIIQSNSGLFGILNETYYSAYSNTTGTASTWVLALAGSTYVFNNDYEVVVVYQNFNNDVNEIVVTYGNSWNASYNPQNNVLTYTVPSSGVVFLGFPGYVAHVSFRGL